MEPQTEATDAPSAAEAARARFEVPIKAQYLVSRAKRPADAMSITGHGHIASASNDTADARAVDLPNDESAAQTISTAEASASTVDTVAGATAASSAPPMSSSKRHRWAASGSERLQKGRDAPESASLCVRFAALGACQYGDTCKRSHDLKRALLERPPDLGPECPVFQRLGLCPLGVACRFGLSHVDAEGRNRREARDGVDLSRLSADTEILAVLEQNYVGMNAQMAMRKHQVDFRAVDRLVQRIQQCISVVHGQDTPADAIDSADAAQPPPMEPTHADAAPPPAEPVTKVTMPPAETEVAAAAAAAAAAARSVPPVRPPVRDCTAREAAAFFDELRERRRHKHKLELRDKLVLAPLTTVGNLPFRRVCKRFGADVTIGEMALAYNLVQGNRSEWSLLRRHPSEDVFGVQIAAGNPELAAHTAFLIEQHCQVDFVDLNVGCPLDGVCRFGAGAALADKPRRFEAIIRSMDAILSCPVTAKLRIGRDDRTHTALKLFPQLEQWGVGALTLHGRTRAQRYTRLADWDEIARCARTVSVPVLGNGDVFSFEDFDKALRAGVTSTMIGRGALIKPWIFTEIKERRHWDISSRERLDMLRDFAAFGLEHWGSDDMGVEQTRRFLLEWQSFLCRYVPVGLLEVLPQRINERPPRYFGRDELETLMASYDVNDWIKLSSMLLGPPPPGFKFIPKHKSNSYESSETTEG